MHSKSEVLDYFCSRCNLVCGWPANWPDLSPIEMMWSIIKFRISNYPNDFKPKNKVELIEAIQREWRSIDATKVNNLVRSFKYRLQFCSRVGGKTITPYFFFFFLKKKKTLSWFMKSSQRRSSLCFWSSHIYQAHAICRPKFISKFGKI